MIAIDLLVLVPLIGALLAALTSRVSGAPRVVAALAVAGQAAALVALGSQGALSGLHAAGVTMPGRFALWATALDGLSVPLVALTVVVGAVAVAAAWRIDSRPGAFFALLLVVQAAVAGVFVADDLVLFYVAWESVLIPMFFLILGWGSSGRRHAAAKYLIYTFAGGALMLVALIVLVLQSGTTSISALAGRPAPIAAQSLVFWLLLVAFLVKLPAVPLHTWLPDAHTEAPTAGSILLAGVLLKMGGYGLMRFLLPLTPSAYAHAKGVLLALGIVGVVWGAACALVQTDLKRLVAYSSVSHMGFVLVGVAVGTPLALGAALVVMVSHGLVAGLLFFLVGAVYERSHTREISRFGGLGKTMPRWSVALVFAALASAGLPGLSGFPGEFAALAESYHVFGAVSTLAIAGVLLAGAYNLRAVRSTVQGPAGTFAGGADLSPREIAVAAFLALGIVALGLAPSLVLSYAEPALLVLARAAGWGA